MPSLSSFIIYLLLSAVPIQSFSCHHSLPKIHTDSTSRLYESSPFSSSSVRFLGRGPNAIVRPGVVMLAPHDEFHHYLRKAAVFIYAMGMDEHDVYVIRGVIIDHPTAFTIGEMMAQPEGAENSPIFSNRLHKGGELGGESAFMLHSDEGVANAGNLEMVGTSGIYQGGFEHALSSDFDTEKAKFFFDYMEFTEKQLEDMLEDPQGDGDAWVSVEVPSEVVLNCDYLRGDCWARLRNAIRDC
jgi:putative AlgH/UPF0301 family transcriptional regulator